MHEDNLKKLHLENLMMMMMMMMMMCNDLMCT